MKYLFLKKWFTAEFIIRARERKNKAMPPKKKNDIIMAIEGRTRRFKNSPKGLGAGSSFQSNSTRLLSYCLFNCCNSRPSLSLNS